MTVWISLLRGINVGGHHLIRMEALRRLYASLGFLDIQTHLQSGNVVFRAKATDAGRLRTRIEKAIEAEFGFHSDVILRSTAELKAAAAGNPFVNRPGMEPDKLAVHFLAGSPAEAARAQILAIKANPEELSLGERELYIYYAIGMARPNLKIAAVEKILQMTGTSRNWNTVQKLVELADKAISSI